MKFRSAYQKRERVISPGGELSLAKQSMKEECDINRILDKYAKTGVLTHVNQSKGTFAELPAEIDYQEGLHILQRAQEVFAGLPAQLRRRFDNDPAAFLAFVENPDNVPEMRELGLLEGAPLKAPAEPPKGAKQSEVPKQGQSADPPPTPLEKAIKDEGT